MSAAVLEHVAAELCDRVRANVPAELLELPVWLHWTGKKVPRYASGELRSGVLDRPEDRAQLVPFEAAAERLVDGAGLGVALGPIGDGRVLAGIDFDHCYVDAGELDTRVLEILAAAASYAERSPSGSGVHVLGFGDVGTLKKGGRGIEIYSRRRFFTVTGERLNRAGLAELNGAAALARKLYRAPEADRSATATSRAGLIPRGHRHEQLLARAIALREAGCSEEEIASILRHVVEKHCEAGDRAIDDGELRRIATWRGNRDGVPPTPRQTALQTVDVKDFATITPTPTRYVISRIVPRRVVTLLGGHGDAGKSYLALVLAAHVACGRSFAGLHVVTGRTLYVSLEDDGDLVKLRLSRIAAAYELDTAAIAAGVTVLEPTGPDATLAAELNTGGVRSLVFTPAFDELVAAATGHDLVIIDNASDAYDADENERRLVRRFVRGGLQWQIARRHDAAVVLNAHLDKAAARFGANGESYSGSTAWHNSTRSRLALAEKDGMRQLAQEKSNLGPPLDHPIALERDEHGVPMPISTADREQHERGDATAVLAAIRGAEAAGVVVPTAMGGPRTALHVLTGRPELPEALAKDAKRIRAALTTLEREGQITRVAYKDSHRHDKEKFTCGS